MRTNRILGRLHGLIIGSVSMSCFAIVAAPATAQSGDVHGGAAAGTVPALMVSDIHFEPFWDPGKAVELAAAPASGWKAILAAPDSPDRAGKFAAVQQACKTRGEDTTYALLASSMGAIKANAAGAKFVTVSGDLISHSFDCKFKAVFPEASSGAYSAFVEKTIEFVILSLRETLPHASVYAALGNNDSDCGDYQFDTNSSFLAALAGTFTADVPSSERSQAAKDFAAGGYYGVSLPAVEHTRLLMLDDLYMSRRYTTCGGKQDDSAATAQISWLTQQLADARRNGEKVWVMAHIPPGVDAYSTATKGVNICAGKKPTMFLSSDDLPQAIASFSDVVDLAIFAHTHMDEMRLLTSEKGSGKAEGVPLKMVSSISPIDGNNPSITVARVETASGALKDYRVIAASNQTGIDTTWAEEYDFDKAYRQPDFSAASLRSVIAQFDADPAAQSSASQSYIHNYQVGITGRALQTFWPLYVCMLKDNGAKGFTGCVCKMAQ